MNPARATQTSLVTVVSLGLFPDHGFPDRGFPDRGFPDRGFPDHGATTTGRPGMAIPTKVPS